MKEKLETEIGFTVRSVNAYQNFHPVLLVELLVFRMLRFGLRRVLLLNAFRKLVAQ